MSQNARFTVTTLDERLEYPGLQFRSDPLSGVHDHDAHVRCRGLYQYPHDSGAGRVTQGIRDQV